MANEVKKSKFENVLNETLLVISDTVKIMKVQVKNTETGEVYDPKIEIHSLENRFISWVGIVPVVVPKRFSEQDYNTLVKWILQHYK